MPFHEPHGLMSGRLEGGFIPCSHSRQVEQTKIEMDIEIESFTWGSQAPGGVHGTSSIALSSRIPAQ